MKGRIKLRLGAGLIVLALIAIGVSACGSSSDTSSSSESGTTNGESSSTSSSEGSEAGGGSLVAAPSTEEPSEIPITKPLNGPVPDKTVAWLACELPICQEGLSRGWHHAAEALGWNLNQINYKTLEPQKGVQQALNEKVEAMGITGIPPAAFEAQAKQAIAEDVPIVSGSEITEPEPKVNGLYYQGQNQESVEEASKLIADWAIHDSGGEMNMATVTIEEYPILIAEVEGLEKTVEADCSECEPVGKIPVTVEDVGEGRVPAKIAAYLQTHPDVNYLQFTFSDLATGVYDTLKPLGLTDKVKLIGQNGNPTNMHEIVEGKSAMWTLQPQEYFMYLQADVLARVFTDTPLEPYEKAGTLPYWVAEKPQAEEVLEKYEGNWPGPKGFEKHFEQLWGS